MRKLTNVIYCLLGRNGWNQRHNKIKYVSVSEILHGVGMPKNVYATTLDPQRSPLSSLARSTESSIEAFYRDVISVTTQKSMLLVSPYSKGNKHRGRCNKRNDFSGHRKVLSLCFTEATICLAQSIILSIGNVFFSSKGHRTTVARTEEGQRSIIRAWVEPFCAPPRKKRS